MDRVVAMVTTTPLIALLAPREALEIEGTMIGKTTAVTASEAVPVASSGKLRRTSALSYRIAMPPVPSVRLV
jgi:hypothetical protein